MTNQSSFIKSVNIILAVIVISLSSCSNKQEEQQSITSEETKTFSIDTTNTLIAQVCKDNKWGYIGTDFNYIIQPQFEQAMEFSEGLACVKSNGLWGFINLKGEFVIPAKYEYPGVFHDGLAKVGNNKSSAVEVPRYIFIDKTGKDVFGEIYTMAEDFNNTVSYVETVEGKHKYIDVNGKELDSVQVDAHPLIYNHFKFSKRPFGGELSKSLVLNPKTGKPMDVKYSKSQYGYTDEAGYPATETVYCFAGEFVYSYSTPKMYFSNKKDDIINTASSFIEVLATYSKTENFEEGDSGGLKIIFTTDDNKELIFDGYNLNSKLIPFYFICKDCKGDDVTKKSSVGNKYKVKYTLQKSEEEGGGIREYKILEAIDTVN